MAFSDAGFVHLHVHTAFSLREGALALGKLIDLAVRDGQPALAVTDTNNLFAALEFSEKAAKADGLTNFEKPAVPSSCTYGPITFRCITYSALAQRNRVFSKILLTGYRDNFLRIRVEWNQGTNQTSAEAEKALQNFVSALVR